MRMYVVSQQVMKGCEEEVIGGEKMIWVRLNLIVS